MPVRNSSMQPNQSDGAHGCAVRSNALKGDGVPATRKQRNEVKEPWLSIVVPAYNEEDRLGNSLKRMLAYFDGQNYAYEILVVSDGSTDGTPDVVEHIA